jgi:hypothetical protein
VKIARAAFINVVQCGGSTSSATYGNVVGDRPGQQGFEIDLVEVGGLPCIKLRKEAAGKVFQTHVPIFNVSHFEPMNEEQLAKLEEAAAKKAKLAKEAKEEAERLKKANEKKP